METQKQTSWLHRLTATILLFTLLYSVIGIPDFHRDVTISSDTDAVSPFNRFIWLSLLAMCFPLLRFRWVDFFQTIKTAWPLISLFLYFTCSTAWALDPDASKRRIMFAWVQIIVVATLTCTVNNRLLLIRFAFLNCVFAAFADLAAWVIMPGYAMTAEGLAGIQLQKNQTGLIMMYGLLAGGALLSYSPTKRERWLTLAGSGILFLVLLASRSKTCLAIIFVTPALLWLSSILVRSRLAVSFTIACAGVASAISAVFGYLLWCGVTNGDPTAPFQKMTFTSRTDLWSFMIGEIQKHPWLGAGFCSFWSINPAVQPSLKTSMWFGSEAHINEAHNGYLDLIATGGLVGFTWGIGVLIYALVLAIKAVARTPARNLKHPTVMTKPLAFFHLGFLMALSIHNFTESNLFSNNALLAVALYFSFFDLTYWHRQQVQHDSTHASWEQWNGSHGHEREASSLS